MEEKTSVPSELEELTLALIHSRAEVERLREREQLISGLLGSINAVLWVLDWPNRKMIYVSPAYERIFGRSAALLLADFNEWVNSIYPDDLEYAVGSLAEALEKGALEEREYRILRGEGELRWISDKCFVSHHTYNGTGPILVGIAEDITDKKQLEGELQNLAITDALTQSYNRRYFFECARREFDAARQAGMPLAFLLFDVDDFKRINDSHGHQVGDQVLQGIARCSSAALRRGDLFGRIGGEEFAVLLPHCDSALAGQIARRLQREIQRLALQVDGQRLRITVSMGLADLTPQDESLDALYSRADAAMYQAKRQGKNRVVSG
ncbi:GGDEF domain-containing protein [Zestomonas thermotolerans]|jgi:diguanylate cyclase (GGDEF)-like protein/PAS domain S-box-containing protein|uniref:GGDEF domain-containing protein n=1 Tax=Zestomonas thermotolerans TaxID=157784 RepID=UPI00035EA663|nr:sensor domain-containing diguanylate cyclase [Pseudomonas thermotolerans]